MGRRGGAITTNGALKIELSSLFKDNVILYGQITTGTISWHNGASIGFICSFSDNNKWLRLSYFIEEEGKKKSFDYKIYFDSVPSNIGKGIVYYFICPVSGRRARILYKCYGSEYWKHREAYQNKIYYHSQIENSSNSRYWSINRKLERLFEQITKEHYKGKETHLIKRYNHWQERMEYYDKLREQAFILSFQRIYKKSVR